MLRNYSEQYWKGHGLFIDFTVALPKDHLGNKPCSWCVRFVAMGGECGSGAFTHCNAENIVQAIL
jgi:hypothetical protein